MLCYTVFFNSIGIEQLAQAAIDYSNLSTANWGTVNRDIHYYYDENGSCVKKIEAVKDEADPDNNFIEKTVYEYNLQNRLSLVKTTTDGVNWDTTTYKYNYDGIRVEKNNNGTVTKYLVDLHNHTGFSQILEEWTDNVLTKTYIIGDDIIGEADDTSDITYLLYDGQGSVRHHSDSDGNLIAYSGCDTFAYDAYGQRVDPLKDVINDGLFYTGEMYDSESGQYYLRARYYNPLTGLFNRGDPFAGNLNDPQSLHKYLYCHNNPVNNVDPSGKLLGSIVDLSNLINCKALMMLIDYLPIIHAGLWAVTKITALMLLSTISVLVLQQLGVLPHDELVAEIGAILGVVLIVELFILWMLPVNLTYSAKTSMRGMNNPKVKKAVDIGIKVHYDKTTDPTRYSHEGGPTQLKRIYNQGTEFYFARRGQSKIDVTWISGKHPSGYPGSKWPGGINQADFKPDTPTGNAFKLPPNTLRIPYDPETGQIKH